MLRITVPCLSGIEEPLDLEVLDDGDGIASRASIAVAIARPPLPRPARPRSIHGHSRADEQSAIGIGVFKLRIADGGKRRTWEVTANQRRAL